MSTSSEHYFMVGVNVLPLLDNEDIVETFEKKSKEAKLEFVYDGMNGDYAVLGKVIKKGNEYEGFEYSEVNLSKLNKDIEKVSSLLIEHFNIKEKPTLHLFTHWH